MENDPILTLLRALIDLNFIDENQYHEMDKEQKEIVLASMKYADESPWPNPITLEEDVFAP
jgi:pyruvate dehydrogenase E1 component alpha subunit